MMDEDNVFLTTICPLFGCASAAALFVSPLPSVLKARKEGRLGQINPIPYPVILFNCISWVIYSCMEKDIYLYVSQLPGIVTGLFYTLTSLNLLGRSQATRSSSHVQRQTQTPDAADSGTTEAVVLSKGSQTYLPVVNSDSIQISTTTQPSDVSSAVKGKEKDEALTVQFYMEMTIMASICAVVLVLGVLGAIVRTDFNNMKLATGYICNTFAIGFMGSPLSTMANVIRHRDAESLDLPLSFMITFNGIFWSFYGLALNNWFILLPNAIGSTCGALQLLLIFLFRKKR